MKKVIITEEEKKHIKSLYEQRGTLSKIFSIGAKETESVLKHEIPLISQLSRDTQILIKELPHNAKVGNKLLGLFDKHQVRLKSLNNRLSNYKQFGTLELYSKRLSDSVSKTKGSPIDMQQLYMDANFLKKELENIKSSIKKPKEGGVLNKNMNYTKEVETWYNALNTEIGDLSNFIRDFEQLWKTR